jgi:hypothetical protein
MVGFDASIALVIWFPDVRCSVDRAKERVHYLLEQLEAKNERILIPAPALSELLVNAGDAGAELVNQLSRSSRFEIGPFDDLAAIEVALSIASAKQSGNKRGKDVMAHWAKVKFDHQIVAICKVRQVRTLYSDDPALCNFASSREIHTVSLADLPIKPTEPTLFDGLEEFGLTDGTDRKNPGRGNRAPLELPPAVP